MDAEAKALTPGSLVELVDAGGERLGVATFNPHSLIAARSLTDDPGADVDRAFLARRLSRALTLRDALFAEPYYRLAHSEADGLPGLVVDRYGDALVYQINTAGMELLVPDLLAAIDEVLDPRVVVLRRDSPVRRLEGLELGVEIAKGRLEGPVTLSEEGVRFLADPVDGQKTGWYFDQRENRSFVARLANGRRVLDLYCYTGGFALRAAAAGAGEVIGVDRSQAALDLASQAASINAVEGRCRFERGDAMGELSRRATERFDIVVADPPSFVKARREIKPGLRGYRKLARAAAAVIDREGFLAIASCSYHVEAEAFADAVQRGVHDAGRAARILRMSGAGPDHPVHPLLPESAYLKCLVLALD